jgi:hypothetical protein
LLSLEEVMSNAPPAPQPVPGGQPVEQPVAPTGAVQTTPAAYQVAPGAAPAAAPPGTVPQPVVYQQAPPQAAPQPMVPVPAPQPAQGHEHHARAQEPETQELRVYSHSTFFYWWPVWVTGYALALVTRIDGIHVQIGDAVVWMHPSKNLGVIFTLMFFLVILITNVSLRGLASVVAILAFAFGVLLMAYFGWWETVLYEMGRVTIFMNMGFYMFFSSLVFLVWAFSVFVYDRMTYWRVTPGQITQEHVIGGAEKSYDTRGMVFEKHRQDLFRHWVLGLGSGDIEISTMGARRETFNIPNVLFVDTKLHQIQQMIAEKPNQFQAPQA